MSGIEAAAAVSAAALATALVIDRISAILARYGDTKEGIKDLVVDLREVIRRCKEALGR